MARTRQPGDIDRRTALAIMGAAGAGLAVGRGSAWARQAGIEPFEIQVSDQALDDLRQRLSLARWPPDTPGAPWDYGTDRAYLEELVAYWRDEYDWRVHERALNAFDHYMTTVEGQRLHFVHQRAADPDTLPLLMTHGWPGTVWEMLPSVMALNDPAGHGGSAADAFHVVVPSIPGFGFSGEPAEGTDVALTAELWVGLMEQLGYERFAAYGSDWGAGVTRYLGAQFPDHLVGIHTPGTPGRQQRDAATEEEREYLRRSELWSVDETGYQRIQGTKPQTLAFGLTDSPIGLAAWITEKLRNWSDSGGDVESRFSKDQILTLVSIYWHTNTIGTSVRYYHANGLGNSRAGTRRRGGPVQVPQGLAQFQGNPFRNRMPESFIREASDPIRHYSVFERGGHFPAIEESELLVGDLRNFFRDLR